MAKRADGVSLNPQQLEAVRHGEGPALVVAGAGTGKTRVITERIHYLLENVSGLAAENILAVTFTEKAAAEMKHRVVRAVGDAAKGLEISTFHAFCRKLLEQHTQPGQILEEIDYWIFLRRHIAELGLDLFKRLAEPGRFLGDFIKFFSRCQDELVTPEEYAGYAAELRAAFARDAARLAPAERDAREQEVRREEEIARVYAASERLLRERNYVTFGKMLLGAVALLCSDPEILRFHQQRFRFILVDEFQDTNVAQIELLWLLAREHRNIMAVGDDDQAIYRFRGASFASFKKFRELFSDCRVLPLTQNYRSTRRVLRVSGRLIAQNQDRFLPDKELFTENSEGKKVQVVELASDEEEAEYVAQEIQRRFEEGRARGVCYGDFAVLYRAHRHRDLLVEALTRAGIPFVIKGLSILENCLVRDLMAYLRATENPSDNVAVARLLAIAYWQASPEHLYTFAERAAHAPRTSLFEAMQSGQRELLREETRAHELAQKLIALRERAKRLRVTQLLDALLRELELPLLPTDPDRRYLVQFVAFVQKWEESSETRWLKEFVEYLDFFEEAGGTIPLPEEPSDGNAAQLMTVHAAKGLEFKEVFILRMNRNTFPVRRQKPVLVFPERLMKEALPKGDFHVQEERRLAYVAMTRAERALTLTTLTGGRSKPSAFLDDILLPPASHDVEQLTPSVPPVAESAIASAVAPAQGVLFRGARASGSCIYSEIAHWARNFSGQLPRGPIEFSASATETYLTCPLKYKFAHVWRISPGPQATLTFGAIMHRAIARYFRTRAQWPDLPFGEVERIFREEWTSVGFRDAYQEKEYERAGLEQLAGFYKRHQAQPLKLLHQEKVFTLPLGDVVVVGRIDQINRLSERKVEIIEYKTGRPRQQRDADESLQLSLYAAAVERLLQLKPARLQIYNLETNEPVGTARSGEQLTAALHSVQEVAADVRAGRFPALAGYHCRYCPYRSICPEHEQSFAIAGAATVAPSS